MLIYAKLSHYFLLLSVFSCLLKKWEQIEIFTPAKRILRLIVPPCFHYWHNTIIGYVYYPLQWKIVKKLKFVFISIKVFPQQSSVPYVDYCLEWQVAPFTNSCPVEMKQGKLWVCHLISRPSEWQAYFQGRLSSLSVCHAFQTNHYLDCCNKEKICKHPFIFQENNQECFAFRQFVYIFLCKQTFVDEMQWVQFIRALAFSPCEFAFIEL